MRKLVVKGILVDRGSLLIEEVDYRRLRLLLRAIITDFHNMSGLLTGRYTRQGIEAEGCDRGWKIATLIPFVLIIFRFAALDY